MKGRSWRGLRPASWPLWKTLAASCSGRRGRSDRRSIANLNLLVVEKTQARWKSARALSIDRGTANQVQIVGRHALDHRLAGFHQPGQRAVGLPPLPACLKASWVWITARQTLQGAVAGRGVEKRADKETIAQAWFAGAIGRWQVRRDRSPFGGGDQGDAHGWARIDAGCCEWL
jgi:hypothetical protein